MVWLLGRVVAGGGSDGAPSASWGILRSHQWNWRGAGGVTLGVRFFPVGGAILISTRSFGHLRGILLTAVKSGKSLTDRWNDVGTLAGEFMPHSILYFGLASIVLLVGAGGRVDALGASADEPVPEASEATLPDGDLVIEQGRLADRYRRLEEIVLRLAELSAASDPRRAAVLRQVIARSRQHDVNQRFEESVRLLDGRRLAMASNQQRSLIKDLEELLQLMLQENRAKRIATDKQRIRRYLKRLNQIIRHQRDVKARTESGSDPDRLTKTQSKIAQKTGDLAQNMQKDKAQAKAALSETLPSPGDTQPQQSRIAADGESDSDSEADGESKPGDQDSDSKAQGESKPSDPSDAQGQTPSDGKSAPAEPRTAPPGAKDASDSPRQPTPTERIEEASRRMAAAQQRLEEAKRNGAIQEQQQALQELEQARAQLEKILRQLREEEVDRVLALLEARFRRMLRLQIDVYEGTLLIDKMPTGRNLTGRNLTDRNLTDSNLTGKRDHDEEIEAGRLSRQESLIVQLADKTITLLKEEGSSVAFPEATLQVRDDMQTVVQRLAQVKVGVVTQGVEQDIIAALEEAIAAIQQAQKDAQDKKGQAGGRPGEPQEPPLVGLLSELKMIRTLQMRVNKKTDRYVKWLADGQVDLDEIAPDLHKLADHQERIYHATHHLHLEKNR